MRPDPLACRPASAFLSLVGDGLRHQAPIRSGRSAPAACLRGPRKSRNDLLAHAVDMLVPSTLHLAWT